MQRSDRNEEGSVLIIVLILMVVFVSLALYIVAVSRDTVKASGLLLDNLNARLESESALEKLKYVVSTGRFSSWYVSNLSGVRDFPLQLNLRGGAIVAGRSELRLQDTAGKLGLWPPNSDILKVLLRVNGVAPAEIATVSDSLLDWTDQDDLKRINGAEVYFYKSEQGFAYHPRNDRYIQTLGELELIKGMRGRVYDLVKDELVETPIATFNYNTADASLLAAALNVDLGTARALVQLREKKGVLSRRDLANGLTFMGEYFIPFPSMKLSVDIVSRVNESSDVLHAIVDFRPAKEHPFLVERFQE